MEQFANLKDDEAPKHQPVSFDDYARQVQLIKKQLTYQVLVDLETINSLNTEQLSLNTEQLSLNAEQLSLNAEQHCLNAERSSQISPKTISQAKNQLMAEYNEAINAMDKDFHQKWMNYYEELIENVKGQIKNEEEVNNEIKSQQAWSLTQDQNKELNSVLPHLQNFIQTLCIRINYQKLINNQISIKDYISKQKTIFQNQQYNLKKAIQDHNTVVKDQYIAIAQSVCQQKQTIINQLHHSNHTHQQNLDQTKAKTHQLDSQLNQLCNQNIFLAQKVLEITKKQQDQQKNHRNKINKQTKENSSNNNPPSEIIPSRNSENQQSAISIPEMSTEEYKPLTRCEIGSSTNLKTELKAKKFLIIMLVIFTALVSFW